MIILFRCICGGWLRFREHDRDVKQCENCGRRYELVNGKVTEVHIGRDRP